MKSKPIEEIQNFLTPYAEKAGVEIIEVTFKNAKNPVLTVYIDKDGGVDLDTCELFHNLIDAPLDEFDPYPGAYTLNVSSPGVDRPFKTEKDFLRHIGKQVEFTLYTKYRGKKEFEGTLKSYDGNKITVTVNGEDLDFSLSTVAKINEAIIFD